MERPQVSDEILLQAVDVLIKHIGKKIEKHGRGAYAGPHETLGVVTEEYWELVGAVRENDPVETGNELLDVAVGCVFGVASMMEKEQRLIAAKAKLENIQESVA